MAQCNLVYYSSQTENTHRFVGLLGFDADRIPLSPKDPMPAANQPYVLFVPTHGATDGRGAIPKQVSRFLNDPERRANIRGVIAAGNRNFGETYCLAGKLIASKCSVPLLYRFELFGTTDDQVNVKAGLERFWKTQS